MNEKYFPKRYRFILASSIIEDAHKLVDCIEAANAYPITEEYIKRRRLCQKESYIRTENLFRKFILAENLGFTIPEGTLKELGEMLIKQETLIKKWTESDKDRLQTVTP